MKFGKCKICEKVDYLQKHHYIPQRVKKTNHYVHICDACHKKIHPENAIIIEIHKLCKHHKELKKFIKKKHPKVWKQWKPLNDKIKEEMKKKYGVSTDNVLKDD